MLITMRSQFRAGVYRQLKTTARGKRGLRDNLRYPSDKSHCCILDRDFTPPGGKKEKHDVRFIECSALMRPRPDMQISCDYGPPAFLIECRDPFHVGRVIGELFAQRIDVMIIGEKGL
jgi:hypothetical protein